MQKNRGEYIVMWHMLQEISKPGFLNKIIGNCTKRLKPIIQRYESEEVATFGYTNIKNNGGIKPYLLKVIRE
ncbi:MAG: hypothetical protein U9Q69_00100 [Nanoarchaeota archaeon]|nr:hypothetical protein [Nanoarchaeota archaeon]